MAGGRRPHLTVLKDNSVDRHTKAELQARAEGEPTGASAKLVPPKELSSVARAEWRRVVKLYRQLDAEVINDLDLTVLATYCENVAIFKAAQIAYQSEPLTYYDNNGKRLENPNLKIMDTAGKTITRAAEQLLLSPVGRARMGVLAAKKQKAEDPMEQWLARKQNQG